VPQKYLDEFSAIDDKWRQLMHAMVHLLDINVGAIVDTLKRTGMWNNTLLVFHSDNGGEIMAQLCGGNNWPLRGGKFSNFEGGIRVNGFLSGGYLPLASRGKKTEALMSVADFYSTYGSLAGLSVEELRDSKADEVGLPPVDSISCWPALSGESASCRDEIPIGDTSSIKPNGDGDTLVGGIVRKDGFKLLVGAANKQHLVGQYVTTAPLWPNTSFPPLTPELHPKVCGRTPETGCLFNVLDDPQENINLALSMPDLFLEMMERIDQWQTTVYSPVRGDTDPMACEQAEANGLYWGPWLS
jgi:arylsulfatase B